MSSPPPQEAEPSPSTAAADQDSSATHNKPDHSLLPKTEAGESNNGEVPSSIDQNPSLAHFKILDSVEYVEKYKKYEADYTHRLMARYFSRKNLYGGYIFDEKTTIGDETIMSSRWPCTSSFADPVKAFEEQSSNGSSSPSET